MAMDEAVTPANARAPNVPLKVNVPRVFAPTRVLKVVALVEPVLMHHRIVNGTTAPDAVAAKTLAVES